MEIRDRDVARQGLQILQQLQDSGRSERDIRDEVRCLRNLAKENINKLNSSSHGSPGSLYAERLHRVLSELDEAINPFLETTWIGAPVPYSGATATTKRVKKKRSRPEPARCPPKPIKRRKTGNMNYFMPPELMSMVISHTLQAAEPRCAFDLVAPDWNICRYENEVMETKLEHLGRMLNSARVVTYTRGTSSKPGKISHDFDQRQREHLLTPFAILDPNAIPVNTMFSSEYLKQFHCNRTHVFTLSVDPDISSNAANRRESTSNSSWRDVMPLRGQKARAVLPYDDEPADAPKVSAFLGSAPVYHNLRHIAVHSPLELMQVNAESLMTRTAGHVTNNVFGDPKGLDDALDLDRSAHLWLSWSQMPRLESVFLDLRIYSHDLNTDRRCLSRAQVVDRAREMGRHLQLRTLVLVGLQSYSFCHNSTRYDETHIEDADEIAGEPNWIKVFRPAVRPGGKIVLVDKLVDE
ncbi:hypothetical protein F5Y17DRAFT_440982 [Xylariaceae sp. FL0594]|nr:hypothetical protein F5Y17DRAFT_440982 [Xylariaceae sp. FL0594]